jgi:DNA-binding XRE family transcriptional regulator
MQLSPELKTVRMQSPTLPPSGLSPKPWVSTPLIGKSDMKTLKEIRGENHLTAVGLAVKANLSRTTIVKIEKGLPVRRRTRSKIAKALHKRPSDIDFNLSYKLP